MKDGALPSPATQSKGSADSGFVSESHRKTLEIDAAASVAKQRGDADGASSMRAIADKLASSMGESGRYAENPFSQKENGHLYEQFRLAATQRLQRELDIVGKEADVGHGI